MSVQIIENQTFDQERALYGSHDLTVRRCAFSGPADGESAFKECSRIAAEECFLTSATLSGTSTASPSAIQR